MNKLHVLFLIISLLIGITYFVATENVFISSGVIVIFILFTFFLYVPLLVKYEKVTKRFHECYHFINNFIISLSIKKVVSLASENTVLSMDDNFIEMMKSLENMDEMEKLRYLNGGYFPFHIYRLFIQVIELYMEQGGDILESSKYLLEECRYNEEYVSKCASLAKHKYVNYFALWGITLSILILLRFTLTDFYGYIKTQPIFVISLAAVALFLMISIFLLIRIATDIKIKGYDKHEKII